eukprot:CAMPEP_0172829492 /NCGR_PEP_ID=MMETSP1075-20121228/21579_1 /TAXON_ID=2916 /ORGANISM="Ceratium fusus, Strain PA161109" /LENGTH=78 /DNA_ID=CAMNT_0013671645 /DNA_START=156 /DNA_END=392 /DNA_ORIENTATION=-
MASTSSKDEAADIRLSKSFCTSENFSRIALLASEDFALAPNKLRQSFAWFSSDTIAAARSLQSSLATRTSRISSSRSE